MIFPTLKAVLVQRFARARTVLNDPATGRTIDQAIDGLGSIAIGGTIAAVLSWVGLELGEALAQTREMIQAVSDLAEKVDAIGPAMAGER
jgi:hypothetical protein